jgi:hypothetical protein
MKTSKLSPGFGLQAMSAFQNGPPLPSLSAAKPADPLMCNVTANDLCADSAPACTSRLGSKGAVGTLARSISSMYAAETVPERKSD